MNRFTFFSTIGALSSLLTIAAAGCGGDPSPIDAATSTEDTGTALLDAPGLDAASLDAASLEGTRTTIGAAGGTARSADGAFELIVLPGALTEDTEITITPVATADVPADVAATDPISTVYSVEPDGLTFGGDGAYASFHWDTAPAALIDDAGSSRAYGAAFGLARPAEGGAIEAHVAPETVHREDGSVELVTPLAHLSLHWAVRVWDRGEYWLGTDFGASPHEVGVSWRHTNFVRATVDVPRVTVGLVARGGLIEANEAPPDPDDLDPPPAYVRVAPNPADTGRTPLGLPPLGNQLQTTVRVAAATDVLVRPYATWTCMGPGTDVLFAVADFTTLHPSAPRVWRQQQSECVEAANIEVSILDEIPGFRENRVILTDTAPLAEARVETRGEGTRTVNLADSPWFATFEPAAAPVPAGPSTITATNNGATMTATRDPVTGEYDPIIDDPALWDADALTRMSFGGTSLDVMPTPPLAVEFGAVDGLDTSVTPGRDTTLSVHFPGELRCGLEDFVDVELFRSIVDDFPIEGPLREALGVLASHCETTVAALTARPFTVEVSRAERVYVEMPGVGGLVRVGRAVTVDGADLLATCGASSPTYCTDRCVDTTDDPMNCGGCGVVGVETCDGTDDDCDGYVDNGCPTTIVWPVDVSETSPLFGDTMSASTGTGGSRGAFFNPYIGLCGTTSSDGTIRTMLAMIATVGLRRTGTDAFALDVTPGDNTTCSDTTRPPSGGMVFRAECPTGMIAEGVSGQAPAMGQIGQLTVTCARWGVMRDVTRRWVIRRTESGMSMSAGTGPGMPFSFMPLDHPTTDNPPALRYLRSTFRSSAPMMMPGGVLWFQVGAVSPELR